MLVQGYSLKVTIMPICYRMEQVTSVYDQPQNRGSAVPGQMSWETKPAIFGPEVIKAIGKNYTSLYA